MDSRVKIVILHGWGQSAELWKNFAQKFGKNASSLDLPGFGEQKLINANWGVPDYAKWVLSKIRKNIPTILIGHSFGGRVAAEIASKNPPWLVGLVLSGAPCIYRPSAKTRMKISFIKTAKNLVPKSIKHKLLPEDLKQAKELGLEKIFRNVVNYDQTEKLQKIQIPTLLVWGEEDKEVPLNIAVQMNTLIKASDLKIINHSGHNAFLEKPELFYGYLKSYISNL